MDDPNTDGIDGKRIPTTARGVAFRIFFWLGMATIGLVMLYLVTSLANLFNGP